MAGNKVSRLRHAAHAPPADPTATRSPVAPLARSELGDLAARRVATASESKAATAPAWRRQVRSSYARAGAYDQAQTCLRGRTRISPATSRILLGALVWKSASGEAHRRHRASRRTRSWRGAPQRRRAGWSCFVDRAELADRRHDPVWTALLGRTAAAARRRRVLVHQVQLERAGFRSDRASSPSKRSPAGVPVEVCPLRRCLFVVGLITIFKEGVCSSRCWSMRSQVPMRR
jgi:hypothetical protein